MSWRLLVFVFSPFLHPSFINSFIFLPILHLPLLIFLFFLFFLFLFVYIYPFSCPVFFCPCFDTHFCYLFYFFPILLFSSYFLVFLVFSRSQSVFLFIFLFTFILFPVFPPVFLCPSFATHFCYLFYLFTIFLVFISKFRFFSIYLFFLHFLAFIPPPLFLLSFFYFMTLLLVFVLLCFRRGFLCFSYIDLSWVYSSPFACLCFALYPSFCFSFFIVIVLDFLELL